MTERNSARVTRAALADQRRKRAALIVAAHDDGATFVALAQHFHLSDSRVAVIYRDAKRLQVKKPHISDELTVRLRNALNGELYGKGCELTPQAVKAHFTLAKLKRVPNIGVKCINELNVWLTRHGQEPIR